MGSTLGRRRAVEDERPVAHRHRQPRPVGWSQEPFNREAGAQDADQEALDARPPLLGGGRGQARPVEREEDGDRGRTGIGALARLGDARRAIVARHVEGEAPLRPDLKEVARVQQIGGVGNNGLDEQGLVALADADRDRSDGRQRDRPHG